ncbi:DUF4199 domain-containing protein [Aestuariivivens sediminis]|uniref:DUF4199 domain-containing protein n=1 Tax=Aestuariivivens sediminis TaxID=2913557 RepID=UPI001F57E08A|nr:DUF4199 domain-containing protein [Aestuariivivens sediminis]
MKQLTLPIRFGLVTSAVLIAYFLLLSLLHKHVNPVFSFFNAVITAFGIFEAIRVYKLQYLEAFSYGEGFKTGLITGGVATVSFTAFFLLYASELNTDFIPQLLKTIKGGFDTNVGMVTAVVAIMGFATTVICTLTIMQLFKKSKNIIPK